MIIGITGFNGAGKTTVTEHLATKGFKAYTVPELVEEKALGNGTHCVIDNITASTEIETLENKEDFILLHVDAPAELRFERMIAQHKEGSNYEEILAFEKEELETEDEQKEQIQTLARKANIVLVNDEDLEELYNKLNRMVLDLHKKYGKKETNWDDYFMSIAQTVAKKSSCIINTSGTIVVQGERFLTTGYVDTPREVNSCSSGGCSSCMSGVHKEQVVCLCVGSEENAIIQAAYYGISLKGATLYTTTSPTIEAAKAIINAGVAEVVYNLQYPLNDLVYSLLQEAEIVLRQCGN
jgi:dCMP deaminase|tara:strand:- start:89953 stop:90840 length:888 start_codon:yes stop_codon:yes gene_type:complete